MNGDLHPDIESVFLGVQVHFVAANDNNLSKAATSQLERILESMRMYTNRWSLT